MIAKISGLLVFWIFAISVSPNTAFSADSNSASHEGRSLSPVEEQYYNITSVEIRELNDDAFNQSLDVAASSATRTANSWSIGTWVSPELVAIGQIINLGKVIWTIVEKNRPVVNMSTASASALPKGVKSWLDLQGWQRPRSRLFRATYENGFGVAVVDFTYRVMYTAGGSLNGTGRYLTQVTVQPADLSVAWGYTFNAQVTVPSITNAGTTQSPLAAAEIALKWSIDTVLKHQESTASYYVRGDGYFLDTSNGNSAGLR